MGRRCFAFLLLVHAAPGRAVTTYPSLPRHLLHAASAFLFCAASRLFRPIHVMSRPSSSVPASYRIVSPLPRPRDGLLRAPSRQTPHASALRHIGRRCVMTHPSLSLSSFLVVSLPPCPSSLPASRPRPPLHVPSRRDVSQPSATLTSLLHVLHRIPSCPTSSLLFPLPVPPSSLSRRVISLLHAVSLLATSIARTTLQVDKIKNKIIKLAGEAHHRGHGHVES
ncbi:hypothetical protein C8R44DRAFT_877606 [Mycena epipterygia]|nr:hypothetical protein C8R44DRAFT_877606 [Mycena epipterygia]